MTIFLDSIGVIGARRRTVFPASTLDQEAASALPVQLPAV
jgi:hypothetical protein